MSMSKGSFPFPIPNTWPEPPQSSLQWDCPFPEHIQLLGKLPEQGIHSHCTASNREFQRERQPEPGCRFLVDSLVCNKG